MSSTCLGRQISLLNSPRFMRSSCVSCECFANSHAVWRQREISDRESGAILKSFCFIIVFLNILLWLFLFRLVIDLLI